MKKVYIISLVIGSILMAGAIEAGGKTEQEKIHLILNRIGSSPIAFIRNGKKYSGKEARAHLEMKLRKSWVSIDTVDDFITYIASKSYLSGRYYYVQFPGPGGKKMKASDWLRMLAEEIEKEP